LMLKILPRVRLNSTTQGSVGILHFQIDYNKFLQRTQQSWAVEERRYVASNKNMRICHRFDCKEQIQSVQTYYLLSMK
jgi:hypothetical protein